MTIAIILGTRPEIIKMAPVIRECQKRGLDYSVIHIGQHYSYQMDRIFFQQLELPPRQDNLDLALDLMASRRERLWQAGLEKVLMDERPDVALVQGDTNTVLAGPWQPQSCRSRLATWRRACAHTIASCPRR